MAKYLINKGMSDEQLSITSFADKNPIQIGSDPQSRQKNRRIEIKLLRVK